MLQKLDPSVWFNPNLRWFEPSAGSGNFLVEVKARLLQAGHDELHILDNMLYSLEVMDDNHWLLQHRLKYLVDGKRNKALWPKGAYFSVRERPKLAKRLNHHNPYHEKAGYDKDDVFHHRNHVCDSALDYDMTFGRKSFVTTTLPLRPFKELGAWPETDTPDRPSPASRPPAKAVAVAIPQPPTKPAESTIERLRRLKTEAEVTTKRSSGLVF
jgi:hypothetical protein